MYHAYHAHHAYSNRPETIHYVERGSGVSCHVFDVMMQQESHVSVTCDENTARLASQELVLNAFEPLTVTSHIQLA